MAGRSAIGLDIGTSGVRAAELSFGKGQVTLEKFGQVALPEGAVRDGEVVDPDAVAAAIKQLWAHTKFSSKKVVIGVANQKVIVRQVDLPWMPADELKKSLAFQVQDFVPDAGRAGRARLPPARGARPARAAAASCAACSSPPRATWCNASLEAVQKAGLSPVMVDLTSFAVIRSLADADHLGMGAQVEALVDVGARVTNIVVHQGGVPRFVRILLMGGQDVTDAVAERMGVPQEQAEAHEAAARPRRRRRGHGRPGSRPASSRPSAPRSSTRSAARSTTTSPPAARPRSRGSSSPAAVPASAASPSGCRSPPGSRSRSAPRCTACRSAAPACRPSRSRSSSRWPPCRSAWPWELRHEHADRARDHHPARHPAAGQPAAAGDRARRGASAAAGRPRCRRRRRASASSARSRARRQRAGRATRRTSSTPPRRSSTRAAGRGRASTPRCPLVYAAGRRGRGAARRRPWARRSAGRTSSTTSA